MKLLPTWPTVRIDLDDSAESVIELSLIDDNNEFGFRISFEAVDLRGLKQGELVDGCKWSHGTIEDLPISAAVQMRDFLNYALRNVK